MQKTGLVWLDGKLIPWNEALISIQTHALHYGLGVFEGVRCYNTSQGPAIFRLQEHIVRFYQSAAIAGLELPFSQEQFFSAISEMVRVNKLEECYIRPLAFVGSGRMGLNPIGIPVQMSITLWNWGAYLGEEGLKKGVTTKISSFTRTFSHKNLHRSKITGNYVTSQLAKMEALKNGVEEAILLDGNGNIAEGTGENIFIVKNGQMKTPPLDHVLEGITRNSVMALAQSNQIKVSEEFFTKEELYAADEAFFTGTAVELTPIREVDGKIIGAGNPGPVFKKLNQDFKNVVHGRSLEFSKWLTFPNLVQNSIYKTA